MILSIGTVSLDTIETDSGKVVDSLGGSAVFFSVAASFYNSVSLVGVAGQDFPQNYIHYLQNLAINLEGLTIAKGKTFRWVGRNIDDVFETIEIQKNTLDGFSPVLSETHRKFSIVFLGNTEPEVQLKAIAQVENPNIVVFDTCNYYIENKKKLLEKIVRNADIVLLNKNELARYSKTQYLSFGVQLILSEKKVKFVIVKQGKKGVTIYTKQGVFFNIPAFQVNKVIDDTGAGDCFAGGFVGYLSNIKELTFDGIKNAAVHGSIMGSFAVENFGLEKFKTITYSDIYKRYKKLIKSVF